jgi:endo-1,4-beta-xylanase
VRTVFTALLLATRALAIGPEFDKAWRDPEIEQRIQAGIRAHRMGFGTLRFVSSDGKPLSHVEIELRLVRHQFLFGCNLFFLDGYPSAELNRRYEQAFLSLFNFATAPFYWSDLEPQPGRLGFGIDSPRIFRRPPPDSVLDFARRHNLTVKGHPLIWHAYLPDWLPRDRVEVAKAVRKRFAEIAARYSRDIPIWDVVNEPLERPPDILLPPDYVFSAMREAAALFPPESTLLVNEVTSHWTNFRWETSPYYLLLQTLFLRGARVDAIGLQFHLFSQQLVNDVLAGRTMRPAELYRVLDQYADFGRPIHITEITIPTLPAGPQGEKNQAHVVRNLYRLWFSHPKVEAITWWNLADGTAVPRENKWGGGLLREDLSPKPSFRALEELIRKEWQTHIRTNTGDSSELRFQGFYGDYAVTARHNGRKIERQIRLSRTGSNDFLISF